MFIVSWHPNKNKVPGDIFIVMFEIIGIIASVLIVISSLSKTTTFKGTLWFRSINMLGNAFLPFMEF